MKLQTKILCRALIKTPQNHLGFKNLKLTTRKAPVNSTTTAKISFIFLVAVGTYAESFKLN